jgi:hypothetical protein
MHNTADKPTTLNDVVHIHNQIAHHPVEAELPAIFGVAVWRTTLKVILKAKLSLLLSPLCSMAASPRRLSGLSQGWLIHRILRPGLLVCQPQHSGLE